MNCNDGAMQSITKIHSMSNQPMAKKLMSPNFFKF